MTPPKQQRVPVDNRTPRKLCGDCKGQGCDACAGTGFAGIAEGRVMCMYRELEGGQICGRFAVIATEREWLCEIHEGNTLPAPPAPAVERVGDKRIDRLCDVVDHARGPLPEGELVDALDELTDALQDDNVALRAECDRLEDEVHDTRRARDGKQSECTTLADFVYELRASNAALVALLLKLEWSGLAYEEDSPSPDPACPACGGFSHTANVDECNMGHKPDCHLAAALPPHAASELGAA